MTPTESYAHKRADAETLIRQHAPVRLQEPLIALLRPAIALSATRADDALIPLGASKFGGAPDVTAGFEWPTWNGEPLGFLAQINLEEVAPFDVEGVLPRSGVLAFFYYFGDGDWPYGDEEDKDGYRVFHFASELQRIEIPEGSGGSMPIRTASIRFDVAPDVPRHPYYVTGEQLSELSEEEREQWTAFEEALPKHPLHLMWGYPTTIQDDARLEAANTTGRGTLHDWNLLLQVDTDDEIDFMWGDAGAMFYLMHRDDLAKHDFAQTWLIAQCC